MASIVSGLGKLLNSASTVPISHEARGQRHLESVTEEAHTYDLLYPECGSLQKAESQTFPLNHGDPSSLAAAANSSDERGGLTLHYPQDVRFIVGQYIGGQSRVLFDTQPPLLSSGNGNKSNCERNGHHDSKTRQANMQRSRTAPHSRQSSLSQNAQSIGGSSGLPLSPVNELSGLFGQEYIRSSMGDGETVQSQLAREERQETNAILSSIFGATGHRISAGMKVHVNPQIPPQSEFLRPISPNSARLGAQRRRTPLTRSTTAEDLHSIASTQDYNSTLQQASRRQSSYVLVTKLFYIDSVDEDVRPRSEDKSNESEHDQSANRHSTDGLRQIPTLSVDQDDQSSKKYRTPAFAIAMVIYVPRQLPVTKVSSSARNSPALGQHCLPLSPEDIHRLYTERLNQSVEYILAHWDIIMRSFSALEIIVRCETSDALSHLDVNISTQPPIVSPHTSNLRPSRLRDPPLPALQLPHGALQDSSVIQEAFELTGQRIVSALRIRGVVAGQGRWGVWREEARGVCQWAGRQEQNLFFFNLLSAFLGNHTEWLDAMSFKFSHGRRFRSRDQVQHPRYDIIRHRTIIISHDKMAARRLIFLLAAFLPASHPTSKRLEEPRPELEFSIPTSSNSPLTSSFLSHHLLVRKATDKAQFGDSSKAASDNDAVHSDLDTATEFSDDRTITESPITYQKKSGISHPHGSSDGRSTNRVPLPISAGPRFRKAGTTTTAAILPECAIPIAHFSSISPESRLSAAVEQRPGSSGSIASLALHRTLSRSDSVDHSGTSVDSQSTGRWFWNSRRGSSTETSETPISSAEGLGILVPNDLLASRPKEKLSSMVDDASIAVVGHNTPRAHMNASQSDVLGQISLPKDIPHYRETVEPFPLDLSVNENDGVIDVKLPSLSSQSSSLGSYTNSPPVLRRTANDCIESLRPPSPLMSTSSALPLHPHSTLTSEVAGWLTKFHQDLVLQAVQPYETLKDEIKHAMRTEPPATSHSQDVHDNVEDWTDVCTSLIIDTNTFTLTRITLRRKNASLRHHQADALFGFGTKDNPDEEFVEDTLTEHDATLTEAIEKILSHSGQSSRIASQGPSRVSSRPASPARATALSGDKTPSLEIPRNECKRMVLGALEQVAKSVRSEMTRDIIFKNQYDNETKDPLREGVWRWFEEAGLATHRTK